MMIENIKRFVNEHHTLIVVIISTLVIYFLYWWFCCKDRPSVDKVKGGGIGSRIIRVDGVPYKFLGMNIAPTCPFYVLSEEGELWFEMGDIVKDEGARDFFRFFNEAIPSIIGEPVSSFDGKKHKIRTVQTLNTPEGREKFSAGEGRIEEWPERTDFRVLFNFEKSIGKTKFKKIIVNLYRKMVGIIEKYGGNYFHEVKFIGQGCQCKYSADLDGSRVFPDYLESGDEEKGKGVKKNLASRFSPNLDSQVGPVIRSVYAECREYVRDWYSDSKGMRVILKYGYGENAVGDVEGPYEVEEKDEIWEVADIYPARKVLMLFFTLLALYSKCNKKNVPSLKEYKKMLAAYMIYIHLFNSCCGVYMTKNWNQAIGNSYVYIYDKTKADNKMDPEIALETIMEVADRMSVQDFVERPRERTVTGMRLAGKKTRDEIRSMCDEASEDTEDPNAVDFDPGPEVKSNEEKMREEVNARPSTIILPENNQKREND